MTSQTSTQQVGVSFAVRDKGRSMSKNGRKAQVTVLFNGRSVTRHIVREGGRWVGYHPDDSVPMLHRSAEAEAAKYRDRVSLLERQVEAVDVILLKESIPEEIMKDVAREIKQMQDDLALMQDRGLVPNTRFGEMVTETVMSASASEGDVRAFILSRRDGLARELAGVSRLHEAAERGLAKVRAEAPLKVTYTGV